MSRCIEFHNGNQHGYSTFRLGGRQYLAHRASYILMKGAIPQGLEIDHLCRNRRCVNPAHLEAVTSKVNTLRGNAPSAQNARKEFCPQGHPYSGENLIWHKSGRRRCRACVFVADVDRRRRNGASERLFRYRPTASRAALALAKETK